MEQASPPMQIQLKGLPTSGNYFLIPRHKPDLAKNIQEVVWQAVEKKLQIVVQETVDLDVFQWMEYMRNRQREIQEGPFVDLNQDALILKIYDGANTELGRLRFKNLSLCEHFCCFGRELTGGLFHHLSIHYQQVEQISLDNEAPVNVQEAVDEEWQRI